MFVSLFKYDFILFYQLGGEGGGTWIQSLKWHDINSQKKIQINESDSTKPGCLVNSYIILLVRIALCALCLG